MMQGIIWVRLLRNLGKIAQSLMSVVGARGGTEASCSVMSRRLVTASKFLCLWLTIGHIASASTDYDLAKQKHRIFWIIFAR
jgi:hypothetical protein